jgi:hypothetical protein
VLEVDHAFNTSIDFRVTHFWPAVCFGMLEVPIEGVDTKVTFFSWSLFATAFALPLPFPLLLAFSSPPALEIDIGVLGATGVLVALIAGQGSPPFAAPAAGWDAVFPLLLLLGVATIGVIQLGVAGEASVVGGSTAVDIVVGSAVRDVADGDVGPNVVEGTNTTSLISSNPVSCRSSWCSWRASPYLAWLYKHSFRRLHMTS